MSELWEQARGMNPYTGEPLPNTGTKEFMRNRIKQLRAENARIEENVLAWLRSHGFQKAAYHYSHRAEVDADPDAHRTCAVDVCPGFEVSK